MDAVEYVKQRNRMCDYYANCDDCPAFDLKGCSTMSSIVTMVPIVEQWAKEHPVKTRQSEFLKMWPDAEMIQGVINIHPCLLDNKEFIEDGRCREKHGSCDKCKRDFWLKEIE